MASRPASIAEPINGQKRPSPAGVDRPGQVATRISAGVARIRLGNTPRRAADEEDVALSAFNSFFQGVATWRR
jgi:hypothetical protein